ncbi:hypothetical protein DFP72DRAFT_849436 [Ephemerocybe angulata]|uniref:Uncharacterized protein n=1 Tax=Ephemerocybe angulata TaxID=980116 RepID=A0A8H6HTS5_9AGAR|nr:hypothetical protein DFP72DRAFT_849436 [Tulosesus angulatus]
MDKTRNPLSSSSAATLWAHLAQKDTLGRTSTTSTLGSFMPPNGPQDKTATTMRVLLHDTQMNLEKFSGNVEKLIHDVRQTEQELKTTTGLLEKEQDKLMGDIIDLVNRAQTQIQASVGTPAQALVVDGLFKNVDRRLESLDQRLDAIQAFNQTHSQAIQTQMHTIQSIQNQQNTIIAAVTPLLPLLQANSSPSSKKRNRTGSDVRFSSSPSVALAHVRKKSRIEASPLKSPKIAKQPTPTPPRRSPITINLEIGEKQAAQTPRRPLQDLYLQSPGKLVTPKQSHPVPPHQLAPHSAHRPSSSSKAAGGDNRVDKIIRELSLQQPKGGVNLQTSGHAAQTQRGPVIRPPSPFHAAAWSTTHQSSRVLFGRTFREGCCEPSGQYHPMGIHSPCDNRTGAKRRAPPSASYASSSKTTFQDSSIVHVPYTLSGTFLPPMP